MNKLLQALLFLGVLSAPLRAQESVRFPSACHILIPNSSDSLRRLASIGNCVHVMQEKTHYLITNWHVVRSANDSTISDNFFAVFNGTRTPIPIELRSFQRLRDVAFFEVPSAFEDSLPPPIEFGDPANLRNGEELVIVAHVERHYSYYFDEIPARLVNREISIGNYFKPSFMVVQAMTFSGMSGAPVLNRSGQLMGMVFGSSVDPVIRSSGESGELNYRTGYTYAIPAHDIRYLLNRTNNLEWGVEYDLQAGGLINVTVAICRYEEPHCRGPVPVFIKAVRDSILIEQGLRGGDYIDAVNDVPIRTGVDFTREFSLRRFPGEWVELLIWRRYNETDFAQMRIRIQLGEWISFRR